MGRANFHPEAGNAKGESVDRLVLSAGLYRNHDDPQGLMRNNAGTPTRGLMDSVPILAPYSRPKIWNFDNVYDVNTTNVWQQDAVGSGTGLTCQGMGLAKVINGAADNDFYQYRSKYAVCNITQGKGVWFRSSVILSDTLLSDISIGLYSLVNTGTIDAAHNIFNDIIDGIGFINFYGSNALYGISIGSGAYAVVSVGNIVSATLTSLGFHIDGDGATYFFVNDVYAGFLNAPVPSSRADLYFQFACRNAEAVAKNIQIGQTVLMQDI